MAVQPVCWVYRTQQGHVEFGEQYDKDVYTFPVYEWPRQISEDMINRGLSAYSEGGCVGLSDYERRDVVRAILEEALFGEDG